MELRFFTTCPLCDAEKNLSLEAKLQPIATHCRCDECDHEWSAEPEEIFRNLKDSRYQPQF